MKPLKAWAVVGKAINWPSPPNDKFGILTVAQEPVLEIYKNRADARQAVFYINRDSMIKYEMEIVPVEIRILYRHLPNKNLTNKKK